MKFLTLDDQIVFQESDQVKRNYEDSDGNSVSRKKMKKMLRMSRKPVKSHIHQSPRNGEMCGRDTCLNPLVGISLLKSIALIYLRSLTY